MKNFLLKTGILAMLMCVVCAVHGQNVEIDGLKYMLSDSTAVVTAQPTSIGGDVVIPSSVTYDGKVYSVTALGDYCFYECSSLKSVTISNSVTTLGDNCFENCI